MGQQSGQQCVYDTCIGGFLNLNFGDPGGFPGELEYTYSGVCQVYAGRMP